VEHGALLLRRISGRWSNEIKRSIGIDATSVANQYAPSSQIQGQGFAGTCA
jgi:hypothetical protein